MTGPKFSSKMAPNQAATAANSPGSQGASQGASSKAHDFKAQGSDLRSGPAMAELGLTLLQAAAAVNSPPSAPFSEDLWERKLEGVATDSRAAGPGLLFFALKGENADGHDYLQKALSAGALAAVVEEGHKSLDDLPEELAKSSALIKVQDTTAALGDLARWVRVKVAPKVAAVTGSSGKTTVKEFLKAIFEKASGDPSRVLANKGNLNNHVGLPLTLLSMGPKTSLAVAEMGANHAGEIAWLANVARPDAGVVTMAGRAHLEHFGSIEGAAMAKGELYRGLPEESVAVINACDNLMVAQGMGFPGNKLFFGLFDPKETAKDPIKAAPGGRRRRGRGTEKAPGGRIEAAVVKDLGLSGQKLAFRGPGLPATGKLVDLKLHGRHNALNAAAAAATAIALGLDWDSVLSGLSEAAPMGGRLDGRPGAGGLWIIDDSYNANPDSMEAALSFLKSLPAIRAAILGDMLELGKYSETLHRRLGRIAAESGLRRLALVGSLVRAAGEAAAEAGMDPDYIRNFEDPVEAAKWAVSGLPTGAVVLVKGSRAMALERAASALAA